MSAQSDSIDFDYIMKEMETALSNVNKLKDKEIVLVMGPVGSGKSTVISALMGLPLEEGFNEDTGETTICHQGNPSADECNKRGWPAIGRDDNLCTLRLAGYPVFHEGREYIFCDMAGLFDNISKERQVLAYIFLYLTIRAAASVKAILFIMDSLTFRAVRGEKLVDTAFLFNRVFKDNKSFDNLFFLINKVEARGLSVVQMEARVRRRRDSEAKLFAQASSHKDKNFHENIYDFLDIMLKSSAIRIIRPLESPYIKDLLNEVAQKKSLDKGIFNFALGPEIRPQYESAIIKEVCKFLTLRDAIRTKKQYGLDPEIKELHTELENKRFEVIYEILKSASIDMIEKDGLREKFFREFESYLRETSVAQRRELSYRTSSSFSSGSSSFFEGQQRSGTSRQLFC